MYKTWRHTILQQTRHCNISDQATKHIRMYVCMCMPLTAFPISDAQQPSITLPNESSG